MTLRTYIDCAIRDGADFDAVISGCDVQQTFCWKPGMCITDACEAEYRALLDAEVRVLAAAPSGQSRATMNWFLMKLPMSMLLAPPRISGI